MYYIYICTNNPIKLTDFFTFQEYLASSNGEGIVDALVNLTGFSLVGGPASQDAKKAWDVPGFPSKLRNSLGTCLGNPRKVMGKLEKLTGKL